MQRTILVVGMAAALACSGVSKEQYTASQSDAKKAKQAAQEQSDKAAALESRVTTLEQENTKLQQQNATLQQQNEGLQSSAAALESKSADLEQKLSASTATASQLQEKRPLKLDEPVLFKENSSKLTPEGKRALDTVAAAVSAAKDKAVVVSGFTDATEGSGKDPSAKRWQLSSARALEVARYLSGRGVDPNLIAIAGFGVARPVAPNDSLANRAMNRRVEIMLVPPDQEVLTIGVKPAELQKGTGQGEGQGQQQDQSQGKGQ